MRGQCSGGAIAAWEFERDGERAPATTLRTSRTRLLAQRAKCKGSAASFKLPSARVSGSAGQSSKHRPQTFCCIRDAPGIMRKPLNAAREAQGREMARFGSATARPKNLACHADHFRPQGYHRHAQGFELCALEFLACTPGFNRCKRILEDGRPVFPARTPCDRTHPLLIRCMSSRAEAPHRHPNACPALPTTMRIGMRETVPRAASRLLCVTDQLPHSRRTPVLELHIVQRKAHAVSCGETHRVHAGVDKGSPLSILAGRYGAARFVSLRT